MLLGSMFIIVSSFVLMVDHEHENKFFKKLFKVGCAWFKIFSIVELTLILSLIIIIIAFSLAEEGII